MGRLSEDCFAHGEELLSVEAALALLERRVSCVAKAETVPLAAALDRILAADLVAARDVPPADNSAVDGYAIQLDDLAPSGETRLALAGRAVAGHPLGRPQRRGEVVRIFTGAVIPEGADTVVMQEDCRREGESVLIPAGVRRGANRRRAGEDVAAGSVILAAGRRLRPQDLGLAASVGSTALPVRAALRVAVFSTGDELREPGSATPPGTIYDANRFTLVALLSRLGCRVADLGILPDRADAIREALAGAAAAHDAIVTSGGVSEGEEDHVRAALEALGRLYFWRLAIKPGRPLACGQIGGTPFVGLPGNPVAMMVTFLRFARPLLLHLMGCAETAPVLYRVRADFEHRKKEGRREWVGVRLVADGAGGLLARKFPRQGAGILSSMIEADGLAELPESLTRLERGSFVDFLPFSGVS